MEILLVRGKKVLGKTAISMAGDVYRGNRRKRVD
jgi:hypothetical protein